MRLTGIIKRSIMEYKYFTTKNWSLKQVGMHFDETKDYDDINKETYSYFRRFTDGYRLCNIPDNSYILDFGCRTGNGTLYFAQQGKVKKAVCVDFSDDLLEICVQRLKESGIPFEIKKLETLNLPFEDNEFDAILCFETIEHLAEPEMVMMELARVIKEGGELILTTPNVLWEPVHWLAATFDIHHSEGPHRFIRKSRLIQYIKNAGFEIAREETTVLIPDGPEIFIKFGEWFERKFPNIMSLWGLRRIFVCRRISENHAQDTNERKSV